MSAIQPLKGLFRILFFFSSRDECLKVNTEHYLKAILSVKSVIMTHAIQFFLGETGQTAT